MALSKWSPPCLASWSWAVVAIFLNCSEGGSAVKNHLPVQETWVQSLGWEDPLEKEMAAHSSVHHGEFHGQRILATVPRVAKSQK